MKIIQISPYVMSRPGGVQTHVRDLSSWLTNQGHEVQIIAPHGPIPVSDIRTLGRYRNVTLHGTRFELSIASAKDLRRVTEEVHAWGAEVVHLHTPWTPLMPWQLWRRLRLPSVATFHATLPTSTRFDPIDGFLRGAARYFNKRLAHVVVPSFAPQRQWKDMGITPPPGILPPTINLAKWRTARDTKAPSDKPLHVVYMGRLEARKGVDVLLDAWPTIAKALPASQLTIAGDGEQRAGIAIRAAHMPGHNISLIPPPSDQEAPALIASADFFAAPATHGESFGLVLIEAMAAGALPVAAHNPGFATVLTGPGQELLVPPKDAQALAQKIISLAQDRAHLENLKHWAQSHAQTFDVTQVGPHYVDLYKSAIESR